MFGKNFRLGIPGEKTQRVKSFDNGGGGRFLEILSCPPIFVAPQMPPPPNSEAWRHHCTFLV